MRSLGKNLLCVVVVALCLTITGIVRAQTNTVTVVGVITDASGAVVPAVKVTAINSSTGEAYSATSDSSGRYTLVNLKPGTYSVQATGEGFATVVRHDQSFLVGETTTLNFQMSVASVAQTVTVSSAPPTISTTESVVGRVIEQNELDDLPTVTRSFSSLSALSPGVQLSGSSVLIGGSTSYQSQFFVDGTTEQNSFFGGQFISYAQDWIQEFSLVSEMPPAQYGHAQGGFVNAITRSGGNAVHGRVYGYFQNAALNATPEFLPKFAPTKPPYNQQRIGGMIGGPIEKDKLFYFIGYEYYHNVTSEPVNVPAAFVAPASSSGVFPVTSLQDVALLKIDYQKDANNHFSFDMAGQYNGGHNSGVGTNITVGAGSDTKTKSYRPSGSWTRVISPTEVNDLEFEYSRQTPYSACNYAGIVGPYPGYPSQPGSTPGGDPVGWWANINYPQASVETGCPTNYSYDARPWVGYRETTLTNTLSITRGAHDIKVGAEVGAENLKWFFIRNSADGAFSINGLNPFNPATPATFPTLDEMNGFGGGLSQHYDIWGPRVAFFVQDSFKVKPTLTLNYGLRYDLDFLNHMFTQRYVLPNLARVTATLAPIAPVSTDFGDLAPRFGYAWTPFNDNGKTVLRGGVGVFYDETHDEMTAISYGQAIDTVSPVFASATVASENPYCYSANCSSGVPLTDQHYVEEVLADALATYTIPNFTLGTYTFGGNTYTIPAPTIAGSGGTVLPAPTTSGTIVDDPNFRIPGEFQISQGIAHEFGQAWNVQADFVYIRGFRQILFKNSNINQEGGLVNPTYGSIKDVYNGGFSSNKSLRVKATYRDHRGDSAQLAYTFAYATDDGYGAFGTASTGALQTDPFDATVDTGPANEDVRHNIVLSGVLAMPWGFQLSPIFTFQSALPYNPTTTAAVPGCPAYYAQCYPVGYTRNSLRGDNQINLNARLSKYFKLGEDRSIGLFFEGFNIANTPYYTTYTGNVLSPTFEHPVAAAAMRQLQVAAEFNF